MKIRTMGYIFAGIVVLAITNDILAVHDSTVQPTTVVKAETKVEDEIAKIKANLPPRKPLEIEIVEWGYYYSIGMAKFKLKNVSAYWVFDPVLVCSYHGDSGSIIRTERVKIFVNISAGKSLVTDRIRIGIMPDQAKQFSCYHEET